MQSSLNRTASSSSSSTITDPFTLELAKLMTQAREEAEKALEQQIALRRKPFVEILRQELVYAKIKKDKKSATPLMITLEQKLISMEETIKANTTVSNKEWQSLITPLTNYKIVPTLDSTNSRDVKFYIYIRNQFELLFPTKLFKNKEFDILISSIIKAKKIGSEQYASLLLHLKKDNYIDQTSQITEQTIIDMMPAINTLLETKLFTKINFIRLLLEMSPTVITKKSNTREYYLSSSARYYTPISSPTHINQIIVALHKRKILTQYNLEVFFNVYTALSAENNYAHIDDLLHELEDNSNNNLSFVDMTNVLRNGNFFALSEFDEQRISEFDPSYRNDLLCQSLTPLLNSLLQRMLNSIGNLEETPEPSSQSLAQFIYDDLDSAKKLIGPAKFHLDDIALFLLKLHGDKILTPDNFWIALLLAYDLASIIKTYSLLREFDPQKAPTDVLDTIINIAPQYLDDVNAMILWLPSSKLTSEILTTICENARFAKDLLEVCLFEYSASDSKIDVIEIFSSNIKLRNILSSLVQIYNFSNENQLDAAETASKLSFLPAVSNVFADIVNYLETNQNTLTATELLSSAIDNSLTKNEAWLVNCIGSGNGDANVSTKLEPGAYSITYSNTDTSTSSYQSNSLSETDLLTPISANTDQPHPIYSPNQIARLKNSTYHFPVEHMANMLAAYETLKANDQLDASLIELNFKHAFTLATAMIELDTAGIPTQKYLGLLESQPDLADEIANVLLTLFSQNKVLNNIDFILFRKQLQHAKAIVTILNNLETSAYREALLQTPSLIPFLNSTTPPGTDDDEESYEESSERDQEEIDEVASTIIKKVSADDERQNTSVIFSYDTANSSSNASTDPNPPFTPSSHNDHIHVLTSDSSNATDNSSPTISAATNSATSDSGETKPLIQTSKTSEPVAELNLNFARLVKLCEIDRDSGCTAGYLSRSIFLDRVAKKEITNIGQAIDYAVTNPRSRTARILLNLYVDQATWDAGYSTKNFLTAYFKEYKFGFFQQSNLIPKLLTQLKEEHTITLNNIQKHSTSSNRTHRILANNR